MRRHAFLHFFFFVTFFSIGAGALGLAVLCNDFVQYCRNRQSLRNSELSLQQLESLNRDYDALLQQLESDPDLLKRLAPVTLGTPLADPNTAYPKAQAEELAASRKALASLVLISLVCFTADAEGAPRAKS
jgi:hypothetical protein